MDQQGWGQTHGFLNKLTAASLLTGPAAPPWFMDIHGLITSAKGLFRLALGTDRSQPDAFSRGGFGLSYSIQLCGRGVRGKRIYPSLLFCKVFILDLNAVTPAGSELSTWRFWLLWKLIPAGRSFVSGPTFPLWPSPAADPALHTDPSVSCWMLARRPQSAGRRQSARGQLSPGNLSHKKPLFIHAGFEQKGSRSSPGHR